METLSLSPFDLWCDFVRFCDTESSLRLFRCILRFTLDSLIGL